MDQRTDNWLKWRAKGIGSSDAPVIMGKSPWKTPYELWEEKLGLVQKEQTTNWAIERGNRLEPVARAKYELIRGVEMGAATCQHYQLEYMRASMDGWNPQIKRGLEIKCPGREDHEKARAGKIPEKYFPQVQHQILVTGAVAMDYASYYLPKDALDHQGELLIVEVLPDLNYIREYVAVAKAFWKCVVDRVPPALVAADFKTIRLKDARRIATEWKEARRELDALENQLLNFAGGNRRVIFQGTGVRINDQKIEVFTTKEEAENGESGET